MEMDLLKAIRECLTGYNDASNEKQKAMPVSGLKAPPTSLRRKS